MTASGMDFSWLGAEFEAQNRRRWGRAASALLIGLLLTPVPAAAATTPPRPVAPKPPLAPPVQATVTDRNLGRALTRVPDIHFSSTPLLGLPIIHVRDGRRFQALRGVGAAMTDSSAWLLEDELPAAQRAAVMANLFGAHGIGLNFLRLPIAASDFTALQTPYSYDDVAPGQTDPGLTNFSVAHDLAYTVPILRQALALNPQTYLLASPWSSPGWMKQNDNLNNVYGHGVLMPEYVGAFANYLVGFVSAYRNLGITINGLTPQNEPGNKTSYPGMTLSEPTEETLISQYLAPALRAAGAPTAIYGYDSSWNPGSMPFAMALATGPSAHDLGGMATHCYQGSPTQLSALHAANPALQEVVSECSSGIKPFSTAELLISATRNWASRIALWNLALDPFGGPVQPPNPSCHHCTGVVTINEVTHAVTYTLDYYQLGQLTRFVVPGAVRIASEHYVTYGNSNSNGASAVTPGVDDVAFLNPDGSKVLMAYDGTNLPAAFNVQSHGRYFTVRMWPHETATFVWDRPATKRSRAR
jgi:glucosylceramidase